MGDSEPPGVHGACHSPALAAALRARDVAVEEELILHELLADLASG